MRVLTSMTYSRGTDNTLTEIERTEIETSEEIMINFFWGFVNYKQKSENANDNA